MRKVTPDEILSLGAYESVRDRFRARIIAHKRARRLLPGPAMSVVFEDHDTALFQVQEMLRAERISTPKAVREEIDVYNSLVPPDGCLLATLMIEIEDAAEREVRRREYVGLDEHVRIELGEHRVKGEFEDWGKFEDRISAVRYVTFRLPPDGRALLLDASVPARFVVDHAKYQATVELSPETRRSLAEDLATENAESAQGAR